MLHTPVFSLLLPPLLVLSFPWFIIPLVVPSGMWNKTHRPSRPECRLKEKKFKRLSNVSHAVFKNRGFLDMSEL